MGSRPSEDELIGRYFAPLAGAGGLGLRDDAALLAPPPGYELVLTVDAIVEGVHFLPSDPPDAVAAKVLGTNLSDLAAKGADPLGFLLTLALSDGWTEAWLAEFCRGLGAMAETHGCPLLGGDTVRAAGPLTLSVTALGAVPAGRMVRRTTARPGNLVCVTGTIGDAVLGLDLARGLEPDWAAGLSPEDRAELVGRYRRPRPRLRWAPLVRDFASAAMDVSDGLAGDLAKMLRVSGTGGVLRLDAVPWSGPARRALARAPELRDRLVAGGDDYELLFTVAPHRLSALAEATAGGDVPFTVIGEVGGAAFAVMDGDQPHPLDSPSFRHF